MVITARNFIVDLATRKNPFQNIRKFDSQMLRVVTEMVWNLLRGRVKLLPSEAAYLKTHRQQLKLIASARDAVTARRLLSAHAKRLLPPLLPALLAHFQK